MQITGVDVVVKYRISVTRSEKELLGADFADGIGMTKVGDENAYWVAWLPWNAVLGLAKILEWPSQEIEKLQRDMVNAPS